MTKKQLDPLLMSTVRTFIEVACEKVDKRRDLALIETARGFDKWCTWINHFEGAFGANSTEFKFRFGSREFYEFLRGPVAASIAQHNAGKPGNFWLLSYKPERGSKSCYKSATLEEAVLSLEDGDKLLVFNGGNAWAYVNEDFNVYLSVPLARIVALQKVK